MRCPPFPHRWKGRLLSVDLDKRTIEIASADGKKTIRLAVDADRTRILRDGHAAAFQDAKPGDAIIVYYKRQYAELEATEIQLASVQNKSPKSSDSR